jgi:hypothetical protein
MGKKYGPSRVRWLLIGIAVGLLVGIILGNPDAGLMDITSPSQLIDVLTSVTL